LRADPVRLAFLIPAPDYPEPWRWAFDAEARVLEDAGATVDPVPWTEADALDGYDLVLPLVAWGYHERYAEWLRLLDSFEASGACVANPPSVLRWSSDKAYLAELAATGVPTVPTVVAEALGEDDLASARELFGSDALVVKPPISGGAYGTFRIGRGDPVPGFARGRRMIVQPLIEAISTNGEYSLMLFDGVLSHAVLKRPAPGDFRVQPHLGGTSEACGIPDGAEALAKAALAAAPAPTTYARVDILRDDDGELRLMELELVEPALFLDHAPERAKRMFADAVLAAAARVRAA
jgi:glutathione synthase/RimK-type ligase-like ATP-grasp enzyme